MKFNKSILVFCVCLFAGYQSFAQSYLGTFELHFIDYEDESVTDLADNEFGKGEGDDFEKTEDATELPETIIFKDDGTCELYFWAYYTEEEEDEAEEDEDDDDELVTSGIWVKGTWSFDANTSTFAIHEDGYDAGWSLTNVKILEDEDGNTYIQGGFSLLGFSWGIKMIQYGVEE